MSQGWFHIAPQNLWGWLVLAAGAIAVAIFILLVCLILRQRSGASSAARLTPAQQRTLERDVGNLIDELAEMARQVGSQLDARAARLEQLICDADERLERLEQARQSAALEPPAPSPLPAHPALRPGALPDDRYVEIYALADQGVAMQEIAQRLRRPRGEVELILALRPSAARAQTAEHND